MGRKKIKEEEIIKVLESEEKLKLFLDSNVLIAYLDTGHKFNYEAKTIIDPLKDKDCYFIIHYLVLGEFVNAWISLKGDGVAKTINLIQSFMVDELKYSLIGGVPMHNELIFDSFRRHSRRKKFIQAHFNDFMILTAAEFIKNVKIVTCDKNMHEAGESVFGKDIYYLPFQTSKGKSELSRFISDMEKIDF